MSRKLNYQRTEGYWVYALITPEKDVYIGMSKNQPNIRWKASSYKNKTIYPYIKKYGWDNIERRVLIDGLTKEQAYIVEDYFIRKAKLDGFCINKQRSGLIYKNNPKEYRKVYSEEHKDELKLKGKFYYEVNKEKISNRRKAYYENNKDEMKFRQKGYDKKYYEAHKDERNSYYKNRDSKPEWKIYKRVASFNYKHPDMMIETPLEAKKKYLDWGYIPSYVKNVDLY